MKSLRTPDDRFADLPGYPFKPHYVDDLPGYEGLRVHYLDEGSRDAATVWLCLHGQPTWSYLYRKMLPVFVEAGDRVIAPDFLGFGRSDKPVDDAVYGFDFYRGTLTGLIERLDLNGINLVCQDWGGLLGLTLPMEFPSRFQGLLAMNTGFNTGDVPLGEGFLRWREYANSQHDLDIAKLMQRSTSVLSDEEAEAYAAPFPDATYKAGVRRLPRMVADNPDVEGAALSREAREWFGTKWEGKSLLACGVQDPVLGLPAMKHLRKHIRNAPEIMEIPDAGHFVQEWGESVARAAVDALS
ncbi:MAG: alpha/beta fold hydrolase [Planctomycetaceae bacterium]|nr:alpha/beta fold hydrolase [Planctomycetaceae bacterium]